LCRSNLSQTPTFSVPTSSAGQLLIMRINVFRDALMTFVRIAYD
jgi:hypothetical protein